MKVVLCYGDSNTWGWDPITQTRFGASERWPGVLQYELGDEYRVLEEGLPGRTTVWDDPIEGYKNGKHYLIPCLASHKPIDLVIILLGSNDLKMRFSVPAFDIANSAGVLVDIALKSDAGPQDKAPKVLLLAPPPLGQLPEFGEMFEGGEANVLDTSQIIVSSDIDGVHFELSEHRKLGRAVSDRVRQLLGD